MGSWYEKGKPVQVEYGACAWVNPDLDGGVWVLQAGLLDSCAQHQTPQNTGGSNAA